MTVYESIKTIWLCLAALAIGAFVARALPLLDELRVDSGKVAAATEVTSDRLAIALAQVSAIELETQRTEAEMSGLLNASRHDMLTRAEKAQLLGKANAILDDADTAVKGANDELKAMGRDFDSGNILLTDADNSVRSLGVAGQNSLEHLDALTAPAVASLDKLDATMTDVQGVAKDTHAMSTDAAAFVYRELAPARGTWHSLKAIVNFTWSLRGAIGF
jgi:hypothetical protein